MKKFLLVCMIFIMAFSLMGNFAVSAAENVETQNISVESNAVLKVYGYSDGGANYMNMCSFDALGTLISSKKLEAGYVYSIPVVIGGHVEIEPLPTKDFVLRSFSISGDKMKGDETNTHFNVSIVSESGCASFIFWEIPEKTTVFDIRSFKGNGFLTFSTDGIKIEKSFTKQNFYGGFVPSYEDIKKVKTPPPTMRASLQTNPLYYTSPSFNDLIRHYESLNKVYAKGRYTVSIKVSEDAYLEVNGVGKILPKNSTETFTIDKDFQSWQISVKFLGEPPHAAF